MKVYIVVLNYMGKEDTVSCVRSLTEMHRSNFHIVVVDNGSPNDSVSFFKKHIPNTDLIELEKNLGYAGGNNVGIRYAIGKKADAILILNNDTVVDPNFLNGFIQTSKKHPDSILGARIYQYGKRNHFQHFGGNWSHSKGKFINEPRDLLDDQKSWEEVTPLDFVCGCALFVPTQIFEKVGFFEESFFLYYEEIDWCIRAKLAGITSLYCPTAKVWHKESASLSNPRPPQSYFQWRNRIYFIERNFSKQAFLWWLTSKLLYRTFILVAKKWIKDIQYFFYVIFNKKQITKELKINRLAYRASLKGIRDYFFRRFGNGPKWIYQ